MLERRGTLPNDEERRDFLELFRRGLQRPEAAAELGYTGSQFRALCNPKAANYDPVFARQYNEIEESGEHRENFIERLRQAGVKRAMIDSDRLLEKYSLIYDPDWSVLQTQKIDINANIESVMHNHFKHLNAEQIKQIITWVKENEDENIIDAIVREEIEGPKDEEQAA
jgi:hypothetical protein